MTTNTYTRILIVLLCLQVAATRPARPHSNLNYSQRIEYNRYYEHYYNYMGEYICPAITSEEYKPKLAVCTPTQPSLPPSLPSPPPNESQYISDHGNRRHPAYIIELAAANALEQAIPNLIIFATTAIQYSSVIFSTTILLGILQFTFITFLAYIMSIY